MGSNLKGWWVDTGATRHLCADQKMFSTYDPINLGEQIYMGNSAIATVVGKGKIILNSGKELHVSDIRKNLMFGSLLSKKRFKLVLQSNKFILIKEGCMLERATLQ